MAIALVLIFPHLLVILLVGRNLLLYKLSQPTVQSQQISYIPIQSVPFEFNFNEAKSVFLQ